jgi:hypothetical protein
MGDDAGPMLRRAAGGQAEPVSSHAAPNASRVAGGLYVIVIVAGVFAEVAVRGPLVAYGDAGLTARNLAAEAGLWRLGVAADLIMTICDVVLAMVLYALFTRVSRLAALVATGLRLVPDAVLAVKTLFALAPLIILQDSVRLAGFDQTQRQGLALLALGFHDALYGVAMIFFGFNLIALAWLMARAPGWARVVGVMLAAGGVCDLINEGLAVVAPGLAGRIPSAIGFGPIVAELALTVWLLAGGGLSSAGDPAD